jgi:thiol-disulfide isomerase/thioredoxin
MSNQIINEKAPELRVTDWIDGTGHTCAPLKLDELGNGYKVLFCFQHWCPGCHSFGFPTLKLLIDNLSAQGFGFAAIQTVFEGEQDNTFDKLKENQQKYGLNIPFGHDLPLQGQQLPTLMEDYQTGGTPWFIVINSKGVIVHNDFRLKAEAIIEYFAVD